ncbi:MAG: glycolate oxidase subunit GlcF [Burkholderiales bacterium]|nr:glycolate oxidase subunit GlcF [Burkholderiales bacterium]
MQTRIHNDMRPEIAEAEEIIRNCVHCGFCNATCPTYRLFGSELEGPRGRIYLVKSLLEGNEEGEKTKGHLERCLTCRSCESTCPSGVKYSRLVHIGRGMLEKTFAERLKNRLLLAVLPHPQRLSKLAALVSPLKPLLPSGAKYVLSGKQKSRPAARHSRRMLLLEGCVQSVSSPSTNSSASRVLDVLGISAFPASGCCGAMHYHMGEEEEAKAMMRRNIDQWWPRLMAGEEAIVSSASGCGLMVKEYGEVLRSDPLYAAKAKKISELAKDIGEVLGGEDLGAFVECGQERKVAFHCPCTLQHGQKLGGLVEGILSSCGFRLARVENPHLCCGAAGTYSLTQREISERLAANRVQSLEADSPEIIVTSNIGCQIQIAGHSKMQVAHWIELLDQPKKGKP